MDESSEPLPDRSVSVAVSNVDKLSNKSGSQEGGKASESEGDIVRIVETE